MENSTITLATSNDREVDKTNFERDNLIKEMKRTKGARFNASKRLEDRDKKRTRNTAYASAAVVVLTLLPAYFPVPTLVGSAISLATIAFSIFILASSLLQSAQGDPVKADQFQRCALEINALRREVRSLENPHMDMVRQYAAKFDEILGRYNVNHDPVDYEQYRLEHQDEFPALDKKDANQAKKDVQSSNSVLTSWSYSIAAITTALTIIAVGVSIYSGIERQRDQERLFRQQQLDLQQQNLLNSTRPNQ